LPGLAPFGVQPEGRRRLLDCFQKVYAPVEARLQPSWRRALIGPTAAVRLPHSSSTKPTINLAFFLTTTTSPVTIIGVLDIIASVVVLRIHCLRTCVSSDR
jgi:hypothetical protein